MENRLRKMNKAYLSFGAIVLVVVALSYFLVLGKASPAVIVSQVKMGSVRDSVTGNVKVHASASFDLTAKASGQVGWVALSPLGQSLMVKKDQTLVQLLHHDLDRKMNRLLLDKKQFEERTKNGSTTELLLEIKERELESMSKLAKTETVSPYDIELIQNEVDRLNALIKLEKLDHAHFMENFALSLDELKAEIKDRSIESPIDGDFTACYVAPGNQVINGNRVGKVHSRERIIEVSINEEDFYDLRQGLPAGVTFFANKSKIYDAEVTALSSTIDSNSGIRKLYLKLVGEEIDTIPVGSSGRAEIIKSQKEDVLLIPRKALVGDYVVVENSGLAEFRNIVVGAKNLLTVEVLSGLKKGENVVLQTPHQLKNGERIKPVTVGF